ncbi:unnamed protein product [Amoebophrya sp. A120]|nr:unnamed protein product [Amoebophrya sp. A120]|eukprot:GSA120T00016164001.1
MMLAAHSSRVHDKGRLSQSPRMHVPASIVAGAKIFGLMLQLCCSLSSLFVHVEGFQVMTPATSRFSLSSLCLGRTKGKAAASHDPLVDLFTREPGLADQVLSFLDPVQQGQLPAASRLMKAGVRQQDIRLRQQKTFRALLQPLLSQDESTRTDARQGGFVFPEEVIQSFEENAMAVRRALFALQGENLQDGTTVAPNRRNMSWIRTLWKRVTKQPFLHTQYPKTLAHALTELETQLGHETEDMVVEDSSELQRRHYRKPHFVAVAEPKPFGLQNVGDHRYPGTCLRLVSAVVDNEEDYGKWQKSNGSPETTTLYDKYINFPDSRPGPRRVELQHCRHTSQKPRTALRLASAWKPAAGFPHFSDEENERLWEDYGSILKVTGHCSVVLAKSSNYTDAASTLTTKDELHTAARSGEELFAGLKLQISLTLRQDEDRARQLKSQVVVEISNRNEF